MVKYVAQSTTTALSNYFAVPNTLFTDFSSFAAVDTPSAVFTLHAGTITDPPTSITIRGTFHTDIDSPVPPATFGPSTTGIVTSFSVLKGGVPAYKLSGLVDISLSELQAGAASNAAARAIMAEIFNGDDTFRGGDVGDSIRGFAGNDRMFGNGGPDVMFGDGGKDLLDGGLGVDSLWGRGGKDVFRFSTALGPVANFDVVNDFEHKDQFQLKHSIFTKLGTDANGHLKAAQFHIGTAAADGNDYIVYDDTNARLYYDADGNGVGAAVQFAFVLIGGAAAVLSASEFDII